MWVSVGGCDWPGGVWLLLRHIRVRLAAGSPVLHLSWMELPLCRPVGQVSPTTRDLVTVSSAGSYRRVERDAAVCAAGPGCAGVHHLSPTAGKWFSQRRLPALLLQAGI